MTKAELIKHYEKRNEILDKMTDEYEHQLRLAQKETPNAINIPQIQDMKDFISRFNQEWISNDKFIEELKELD